jgi:hypothetical protein
VYNGAPHTCPTARLDSLPEPRSSDPEFEKIVGHSCAQEPADRALPDQDRCNRQQGPDPGSWEATLWPEYTFRRGQHAVARIKFANGCTGPDSEHGENRRNVVRNRC